MGLYGRYLSGGYLDAEKMFLFNREQISHVYALGYQDEEQMAFKQMADAKIRELKGIKNEKFIKEA